MWGRNARNGVTWMMMMMVVVMMVAMDAGG
jgi:hypothetical protein